MDYFKSLPKNSADSKNWPWNPPNSPVSHICHIFAWHLRNNDCLIPWIFRWKPDDAVPVVTPCPAVPPGWNRRTELGKCCYFGKTPVLLACVSFWKHVICFKERTTFPGMLTDMCWILWASDEAMWLSLRSLQHAYAIHQPIPVGLEERR